MRPRIFLILFFGGILSLHQSLTAFIILDIPVEEFEIEVAIPLSDADLLEKYGCAPDVAGLTKLLRWTQGEDYDAGHVQRLIEGLGHTDFATREASTAALSRLGYLPVELLEEAKKSRDPEIASRARRVMEKRTDLEADRKRLLSIALNRIFSDKLKVPTELLLKTPAHLADDLQKADWVSAISEIVSADDTEWLQRALAGEDPLMREAAKRGLPRANPELAIELLRPLVNDSGDVASWPAARGLVELGDRLVWKHLVEWIASEDESVRVYGLRLLRASTGQNFNLNVFAPNESQKEGRAAWRRWIGQQGDLSVGRLPLRYEQLQLLVLEEDAVRSLIAHYKMDRVEGGKLIDESDKKRDGTLRREHRLVEGKDGKAVHFKGQGIHGSTGGHAEIPYIDFNGLKEFTVALWVKHEETAHEHGEAFVCYGFDQASTFDGSLCIGSFFDEIHFRTGTGMITIPQPPEDRGRWVHYAMSFREGKLRVFKGGKMAGEKELSVAVKGNKAALGQHWWANGSMTSTRFVGAIDDLRVYNRAVPASHIHRLAAPPK